MVKGHFNSFIEKLATSVDEHLDDAHLFNELKEECMTLLEEFVSTNESGYEMLRMLMHFNVEIRQIVKVISAKMEIEDHHSIYALNFISDILECEIRILRDMLKRIPLDKAPNDFKQDKIYEWTGDHIELVEIVESILLMRNINSGNVTKCEFYAYVGKVLNIDLSNHNKILGDMRSRKDDFSNIDRRIHHLPRMIEALAEKLKLLDRKAYR